MTESDYQIHELADKAGVSVRTIRFYIKEGLLPPPQVRGRYAVYSDDYLERLELIRLLKDRFLPLKEIQIRTTGLSQEEVRTALTFEQKLGSKQSTQRDDRIQPQEGEGDSRALDYVNRLLNRQPGRESDPNRPNTSSTKNIRSPQTMDHKTESAPGEPGGTYPMQEEVWERIYLAPGLELHIQKPIERETRSRLDQLIQYACQLFNL